eukprot:g2650.t1
MDSRKHEMRKEMRKVLGVVQTGPPPRELLPVGDVDGMDLRWTKTIIKNYKSEKALEALKNRLLPVGSRAEELRRKEARRRNIRARLLPADAEEDGPRERGFLPPLPTAPGRERLSKSPEESPFGLAKKRFHIDQMRRNWKDWSLKMWQNIVKESPYLHHYDQAVREADVPGVGKYIITFSKELNLSNSIGGTKLCLLLTGQLRFNKVLQRLDLTGNNIQADGIEILCDALKKNSTVKQLTLAENYLHDGATFVAALLRENTTITDLDLRRTCITGLGKKFDGLALISSALRINSSILFIDFAENQLLCKGSTMISKCLDRNTTLQKVNLRSNYIKKKGFKQIVKSLRESETSIQSLRQVRTDRNGRLEIMVEQNPGLTPEMAKEVGDLCQSISTLRVARMDELEELARKSQFRIRRKPPPPPPKPLKQTAAWERLSKLRPDLRLRAIEKLEAAGHLDADARRLLLG